MLALAGARRDRPGSACDVFFTDDCCLPDGDARRTLHVARESLLVARAACRRARVHPIARPTAATPSPPRSAYGAQLLAACRMPPVLDVVLLDLGARRRAWRRVMPGSDGRAERGAGRRRGGAGGHGRAARGPGHADASALRGARHVIVTATGADRAAARRGGAARARPTAPRRPAQAVLPSDTVLVVRRSRRRRAAAARRATGRRTAGADLSSAAARAGRPRCRPASRSRA